jgi:micrococcal nuclease
VRSASPFHTAAQTRTREVCAAAFVAIGACFGATPTATADSVPVTATVLKVVDGDTIDIRNDDRGRLRVRLLGIDTPETKKPGYTVGCWGPEATEFAKSNLVDQRVAVVTDPSQDRTDRFGRPPGLPRLRGPTSRSSRRDSSSRAGSEGRPSRPVGAAMQRQHRFGSALIRRRN